jgi:Zn-dependent protease
MFDFTQPTPFDLRWQMFGIRVRVHPFFWIMAILLGPRAPTEGIWWVLAVFVSILLHELGHALAAKAFGWWPSILLYSFGGLCYFQPSTTAVGRRIIVAFCGPLAGFLLAALIWGGLQAATAPPANEYLRRLLGYLLFINIWWGILNLLPVYPLDGGQISRIFLTWFSPWRGGQWASYLSVGVAALVVVYALSQSDYFLAILFGLLAFEEINRQRGVRVLERGRVGG